MARVAVDIVANVASYTRGLKKATEETQLFGDTSSKAFEHVGRSLALMTGGFVAFSGATELLRASVDAARDAGVAQRSLAAQMKASGQSFADSSGAIDKAGLSMAKFGFTSTDSERALIVLDRATGSVSRSIQLQGVAANIARAKNITLSQAALILGKAYDGQTTSLKRLGVELPKGAKGMDAIYIAAQKFSGQAAANTTVSERFSATLHDTEVIIGNALLPSLNKLLTSLGDWLEKMNQSGRLQRDVNDAVQTGTSLFNDLKGALDAVNSVTGSTKHTLELLLGVFVAIKTANVVDTFLSIAGRIGLVGKSAKTATGEVDALRLSLGKISVVGLALADAYLAHKALTTQATAGDVAGGRGSPYQKNSELDQLFRAGAAGRNGQIAAGGGATINTSNLTGQAATAYAMGIRQFLQSIANRAASAVKGSTGGRLAIPGARGSAILNGPLNAQQNLQIGLAGDPQNLGLLRQQAAHDQAALEFAKKLRAQGRITNTQYVKEVTAYASDLEQTNTTIAGILKAASDARKQAAQAAADKRKAAAQAAKDKAAQAQQNLFDRLQFDVDRTGLTKTLSDDLKSREAYKAVLEKTIATQGSTLALQEKLLGVELEIQSVQGQIDSNRKQAAADAKDAADAAKQRAKDAATAAAATRDALQFRQLGLGPTGGALVPGVANLQKRLTGVRDAVKGTFLDTSKTGGELDRIAKILGGKFGHVSESVRSAIDQMYKDIRDKLKTSSQRVFVQRVSSQNFVDSLGLNLTGAQKRRIESQFARIGPGATAPTGRSAAFVVNGDMHFHGVQDVRGIEDELTKRVRARGHVRRGSR